MAGLLVVAGCTPDANGANTDGNGNEGQEQQAPAPPTEASYPYQMLKDLAQIHLKYNSTDEALKLFELAINVQLQQTNTEDAENWAGFGDALRNAGRVEEAGRAYQRALAIYEKLYQDRAAEVAESAQLNNYYVERVVLLYRVLGSEEKRREWLGKLRADQNNWQQQVNLAGINEQLERFERAEQGYQRAMELTAEHSAHQAEVAVRYGAFLYRRERHVEAETHLRSAVRNAAATAEIKAAAREHLFKVLAAMGKLDDLLGQDTGQESGSSE
jgi:tetratricopeptide (TPR) repeat protein